MTILSTWLKKTSFFKQSLYILFPLFIFKDPPVVVKSHVFHFQMTILVVRIKRPNACFFSLLLEDALLANFIVMTDYTHGRILQIDLQTGALVKLPLSLNGVLGIVFDKITKTLFYSETSTNTITSTTVHGEKRTLFYTTGTYNIQSNLFWLSLKHKYPLIF